MPAGPISSWSNEDKIKETLIRSKEFLSPALGQQVDALLSPASLAIMAGTLVVWAGSHVFGVGEVVDVALLLVGAALLGPSVVHVAENLIKFGECINAKSEPELKASAKAFADAMVEGGLTVIMAVLLHRSAKGMQAAHPPGTSWLEVANPKGEIGLLEVGVDPQPGTWWSRIPAVADNAMPAGEGATSAYGEVTYSAQGPATEQELVRLHEMVHKFFSPRFRLFRTFRARLKASSYWRSAILRYLEEAMAEGYAQLRVVGFKGGLKGFKFPLQDSYELSIGKLAAEGRAIGTIVFGTQRLTVSISSPSPEKTARPLQPTAKQGKYFELQGGFSVKVAPGSSLSAIAKSQYGEAELWPLIYDLNEKKIGPNPNQVQAGMQLLLLPLDQYNSTQLAEARKRAPSWKSHAH